MTRPVKFKVGDRVRDNGTGFPKTVQDQVGTVVGVPEEGEDDHGYVDVTFPFDFVNAKPYPTLVYIESELEAADE